MKPLSASAVAEPLFHFSQLAFAGARNPGNTPITPFDADAVMRRITSGKALTIKEALSMPDGERRALKVLLVQYIMFLTMFSDLTFPPDFLNGTDETRLGAQVLAYVARHQWPFPQRLPWSMTDREQ
jgi:hypothetical protein